MESSFYTSFRFLRPRIRNSPYLNSFEDIIVISDKDTLSNLPIKIFNLNCKYSTCYICQVDFEMDEKIKELSCNHLFHIKCIDIWLGSYSCKCPICKKQIGTPTPLINN